MPPVVFPFYIVRHLIDQDKVAAPYCETFATAKYVHSQMAQRGAGGRNPYNIVYYENLGATPAIVDPLTGKRVSETN